MNKEHLVVEKSRGNCCYCEAPVPQRIYTKEHLVCASAGGNDKKENLRTCCKFCNTERGCLTMQEFLEHLLGKWNFGKAISKNQSAKLEKKIKNVRNFLIYIEENAVLLYKPSKLPAKYKKKKNVYNPPNVKWKNGKPLKMFDERGNKTGNYA